MIAALDHWIPSDDVTESRIGVLSAAMLRAVMNTYGETAEGFAARAGVTADVITGIAEATGPAWALPYDEFTAVAGAVAALWPSAAFEIATACDLLLTSVINGDHFMATDVLTDPGSRDLARALLRMTVLGNSQLPDSLLVLLNERAAELADSTSPDAWIGTELLSGCLGRLS
ncbi:MAG TPA: hypothetical protein VFQ44_06790 [Streptosporangiaceae bacterium]|nr:hypothetical protein [Streptosporangiaceae bacterium]